MLYIVYKTTNIINKKIYIGVHRTENLHDGYLGSGRALLNAVLKYGAENFTREVLYCCLSSDEMFEKEKEIVNEVFVQRRDTYNLRIGGGAYGLNSTNLPEQIFVINAKRVNKIRNDSESRKKWKEKASRNGFNCKTNKLGIFQLSRDERIQFAKEGSKAALTQQARLKRKTRFSEINHSQGANNSQYGTCWIYYPENQENRKILVSDLSDWLQNGWKRGRKISIRQDV